MSRGDKAREYFLQGYNCSQAVALAFGDIIDLDKDKIALLSCGFGGGMGRMREVCGAMSGCVFVLSALTGYSDPKDRAKKAELYAHIQNVGTEFKAKNGSLICREMLNIPKSGFDSPTPSERTAEYYKKRPCPEIIRSAGDILEKYIDTYLKK